MLCFSFLNADHYIRLFFIIIISFNFIGVVFDYYILNMMTLTIVIVITVLSYFLIKYAMQFNFKINPVDDAVNTSRNEGSNATESYATNKKIAPNLQYNQNILNTSNKMKSESETFKRELYTPRNYPSYHLRRSMTPIVEPLPDESEEEDNHSRNSSRR